MRVTKAVQNGPILYKNNVSSFWRRYFLRFFLQNGSSLVAEIFRQLFFFRYELY